MKKIAILTHYYNSKNLGGLLQAYALVRALSLKGFLAQQLVFSRHTTDKEKLKLSKQFHLEQISFTRVITCPFRKIKYFFQRIKNKQIKTQIEKQNIICKEFEQFIPHSQNIYNDATIKQANADYEVFVMGSDQVFSLPLLPLAIFYGEFADSDKKVLSYAASSDRKKFPSVAEKLFGQKLQRFNAIGVREKTLKDYIQNITGKKAELVLDPTFLLSPQEWLKIANSKYVPQKPYIFCYFLGGNSAWQRQVAQAYADKYGYQIVHLPYITRKVRQADKYLKGQGLYKVGPREFISLINGAKCVFTDSFHGLAFSINFGKNFYVFNRDDESGANSMNARITDTLEMFGLTSRHITDKNAKLDNKPMDFTNAHKILEQEKQKSINWLLKVIEE